MFIRQWQNRPTVVFSPLQQLQIPRVTASKDVIDWLLEEDEPSVRCETLTGLLGRNPTETSVRKTQEMIGSRGWAAKILEKQKEGTYWDNPSSCYVPKFSAGSWQIHVLADLGVTSKDRRISKAVEHILDLHNVETGGVSLRPKGNPKFEPHICATGNLVRALAKMGYA